MGICVFKVDILVFSSDSYSDRLTGRRHCARIVQSGIGGALAGIEGRSALSQHGALVTPELGPPVLKPHLNSGLAEVDPFSEVLAYEGVGVVRALEDLLQRRQLGAGERGPVASRFLHRRRRRR